jgi:hypothetical protein
MAEETGIRRAKCRQTAGALRRRSFPGNNVPPARAGFAAAPRRQTDAEKARQRSAPAGHHRAKAYHGADAQPRSRRSEFQALLGSVAPGKWADTSRGTFLGHIAPGSPKGAGQAPSRAWAGATRTRPKFKKVFAPLFPKSGHFLTRFLAFNKNRAWSL